LYGRAWRWDHKTVFSVLSWFVFATLLLGRARFGLRGRRAVNVIYIGSVLLLLAYVGSRFVLEVVLGRTPRSTWSCSSSSTSPTWSGATAASRAAPARAARRPLRPRRSRW
jgi:hypothetical protein